MKRKTLLMMLCLAFTLITIVSLLGCSSPKTTTVAPTTSAPTTTGAPAQTTTSTAKPTATNVVHWKLQGYLPKGQDMVIHVQDNFTNLVKELSGGRMVIDSLGVGEVVALGGISDAVSSGLLDMGHWFAGYDAGKNIVADCFSNYPFVGTPFMWDMWFKEGGGNALVQEFYDKYKIHVIPNPLVGPPSIEISWTKPVNTLADRKGKKVSSKGIHAEVLQQLGVSVVNLPPPDVYSALQTGLIDGFEFGSPNLNWPFGFHQVAKYIQYPGWHEPSPASFFIVNQAKWDALPNDLKLIVNTAAQATEDQWVPWNDHNSAVRLQDMLKAGVQIIQTSQADLQTLYTMTKTIQDARAAKDPFYAKVQKSIDDFTKAQSAHDNTASAVGFVK